MWHERLYLYFTISKLGFILDSTELLVWNNVCSVKCDSTYKDQYMVCNCMEFDPHMIMAEHSNRKKLILNPGIVFNSEIYGHLPSAE